MFSRWPAVDLLKFGSLAIGREVLEPGWRWSVHVKVAEGDLRGVAVHLAARIMDAAGPGAVFVSATSRELASGAGVEFVERESR